MGGIQKIVIGIVGLVVFTTMIGTVITSIVAAQATTGITTAANSLLDITQLAVAVAGIGLALGVGYAGWKSMRD